MGARFRYSKTLVVKRDPSTGWAGLLAHAILVGLAGLLALASLVGLLGWSSQKGTEQSAATPAALSSLVSAASMKNALPLKK